MAQPTPRRFAYVACIGSTAGRTNVPEIDEILEKTVEAPGAVMFDPEAKIPRWRVGGLYSSFAWGVEGVCRDYESRGWRTECRVLPWWNAYAYELHMEGQASDGAWWVIHEMFAYFLSGDTGDYWLVLAWTREKDKAFREWLGRWVRDVALGRDDCTWWVVEAKPSVGGNYEAASREPLLRAPSAASR